MESPKDLDRDALDRWITGNYGQDLEVPECPEECEDWEEEGTCHHLEPLEDDPDRKRDEERDG